MKNQHEISFLRIGRDLITPLLNDGRLLALVSVQDAINRLRQQGDGLRS